MEGLHLRGIVFGVLVALLGGLLWIWLGASSEDEIDRKLGLKERCSLVQPGWEIDRLHRHFARKGWRSGCSPTEECATVDVEGEPRRFRCDDTGCNVMWQWEDWRCTVPLAPKSRLSMGPGKLDPNVRH